MGCCSLLTQYVNTVMAAKGAGRDITEAIKVLVSVNNLTDSQVDTLCTSVNSALRAAGSGERVSASQVKAEAGSNLDSPTAPTAPGASNPYCDMGPVPAQSVNILNTLNRAAGDICFYGCFAAVLYQTATSRYESVASALTDAGTAFTALIQQLAQAPDRWGGIGLEQLQSLQDMVSSVVNNVGAIGTAFEGKNFAEIMWTYVKSFVARYANNITLGAAQSLVDQLAEELDSRSAKYAILDQKLVILMQAIEALVGYDWWDEFVAAVERAKADVSRADSALSRAEIGMSTGNWDRENIGKAQARLMLAKNGISSLDMIGQTVKELTEAFTSGDPFAFRWNAGRSVKQDFVNDLVALGEVLEEVKQIVTCLMLQGKRIEILGSLITSIHSLMVEVEGHISLNTSIDVQIDSDIIQETRNGLASMHTEMTSVVGNEDRISAPGYLTAWHAALSIYISGLEMINVYPSTAYLDPLGIIGYTEDGIAIGKLSPVVDKIADMSEPRALSFIEGIIRTGGDWSRLMANRKSWQDRMGLVRTELRSASVKDGAVADTCRTFSDYDNEYYNYAIDTLDDMGWKGAKQALERGRITQFLGMALQAGAAFSVGVDCIASLLDGAPADAGIAMALGEEFNKLQAESVVSIRAPAMLPAFQFEIVMSFSGKLQGIQAQLERIAAIQNGVC